MMSIHDILKKLGAAVDSMGGKRVDYVSDMITISTSDIRGSGMNTSAGLEIDIKDIVLTNGVFNYGGENVILFIPDHGFNLEQKLEDKDSRNKYHLTFCQTLDSMQHKGRFHKYYVTTETSEEFEIHGRINGKYQDKIKTDLYVCKRCLAQLNYDNFQNKSKFERDKIRENFDLVSFFEIYSSCITEIPPDFGQNSPGYAADWDKISAKFRENKNWICEECHVDLSEQCGLLHTHHIDGVKRNNFYDNLKALCLECHSNQPFHEHMKKNRYYQNNVDRIRQLRYRQGIR